MMKKSKCYVGLIAAVVIVALTVFGSSVMAKKSKDKEKEAKTVKAEYQSASVCKTCHADIYKMWSRSQHRNAVNDPIFDTSYLIAYRKTGGEAKEFCLRCHSPTTKVSGDYDLNKQVSREGVTCDFCHTITGVDHSQDYPFTLSPGDTKSGPFSNVESPGHKTRASELHTKSEFCGGCHELKGKNGVTIFGTFSEWKDSDYAKEGVECQTCHMPVREDMKIVSPAIKVSPRKVNTHLLTGGHSPDKLKSVASVEIMSVSRNGNAVNVQVKLINKGSGHMLPTGLPSRELNLDIIIRDSSGRILDKKRTVFKKTLKDSNGKILKSDEDIMLYSASIASDNRLKPKEERIINEKLSTGGAKGPIQAEAKLTYNYRPLMLHTENLSIDIGEDTK